MMKILAIETSCDETGLALVQASGALRSRPKFKIIEDFVASQVKVHEPFGGVVPNLAKREHLINLPILFRRMFGEGKEAERKMKGVDLITVTVGPGLEPALWAGITFGKEIAKKYKKPLRGANHLEGHLYSFLLARLPKNIFPAVALIVSGGHTILLSLKNLENPKKLGETRDDAAGEAYDKVARLLELPYPGGPQIEKLAKSGRRDAIPFPRPMIHDKNFDFSFSGLKTSVLYYLRDHKGADKADVAASFEQAVTDVLIKKVLRAAKEHRAKSIFLSGGVASNGYLKNNLKHAAEETGLNFLVADMKFQTDNAVIIAIAGYLAYLKKKRYALRAKGDLNI